MTTEQWKPTVDEVRLAYIDRKDFEAQLNRSWADERAARAEFDRFVAKIKTDALREAADGIQAMDSRATLRGIATSIRVEADRIEEEA